MSFRLLKAQCLFCGRRVAEHIQPGLSLDLCTGCHRDLPWNKQACDNCGQPVKVGNLCENCQQHPPVYSSCIAPLLYRYPVDTLTRRFKNNSDLPAGRLLGMLLAETLGPLLDNVAAKPTVTWVPLHFTRRLQRGFNQSQELAVTVAGHLGLPLVSTLGRRYGGLDQKTQSADRRKENTRGLFSASNSLGGQILLIDDVITSGATVAACAEALLLAGADDVIVAAPARTPAVC